MSKQRQSMSNQVSNQPQQSVTSSSFAEHKCSVRIHLHPSRLGSVKDGVNEQLNALFMTYQPHLQGVILSYSHVHLPATLTGSIFYERPYVNFDITVSFTVLSLTAQSLITGVVHNIARDHIGLLIHSTFNAVISTEHLPSHFKYQRDPQGDSSYVDTRFSQTSELASVDDSTMTKAQLEKLSKAQAKEARRLAYLASQGLPAEPESKPLAASHSDSNVPTHWHNITIGSHIKLSVINVQSEDGLVNIIGSLTAPGAELLLVEPTIPASFHAASEVDAAVMNDADHENEMEKIFGAPHQVDDETDEQHLIEQQVAAASGQIVIDDGHISKKDAKAAKKAAKEASHQAKMDRKRLRASGHYVPAPGQSQDADDDSNVVHTSTEEHVMKKQRRDDAPVSVKKQKQEHS